MKKIVVLLLLLVVLGGAVYAVDGQMGVISSPVTGGFGFTWKNGVADNSVLNLGLTLGNGIGVTGAYHFTLVDAPIANIDWLYWNFEIGPYLGAFVGEPLVFLAGAEAAIGLSFYLAPLFDANIPLELFLQGGPSVGVGVVIADEVTPQLIYDYFAFSAGIRWVF